MKNLMVLFWASAVFVSFSAAAMDVEETLRIKNEIQQAKDEYKLCRARAKTEYDLQICQMKAHAARAKIRSEIYRSKLSAQVEEKRRLIASSPMFKCLEHAHGPEQVSACLKIYKNKKKEEDGHAVDP
ncbi:hypothetical protein D6779_02185 [Candidatus Parcubacteria bacterium]|nr:MAG: hypothetical protein D6779_02185 [Candidatus Parcubacteria bacterium]